VNRTQIASLARRSIVRTLHQPAYVFPPLLFPTLLVAVNAAGLRPSTELDGFPTDSFLAFAVAVPFIQGALFATMNAGTDLARDIQNGFLNRLALTPMRGSALLAGHLAGVTVMGFVQSVFYLVCALAFGVKIESGVAGIVVILELHTELTQLFEHTAFLKFAGETVKGVPEEDQDRTNEQGKASSVQFVHFQSKAYSHKAFALGNGCSYFCEDPSPLQR
jgi:ABC-2 type transport system permease protein